MRQREWQTVASRLVAEHTCSTYCFIHLSESGCPCPCPFTLTRPSSVDLVVFSLAMGHGPDSKRVSGAFLPTDNMCRAIGADSGALGRIGHISHPACSVSNSSSLPRNAKMLLRFCGMAVSTGRGQPRCRGSHQGRGAACAWRHSGPLASQRLPLPAWS